MINNHTDFLSIVLIILTEKGHDFYKAQDLYNEVLTSREKIKYTAPKRKKRETLLWKEFEKSYRKDLEALYQISCIIEFLLRLIFP